MLIFAYLLLNRELLGELRDFNRNTDKQKRKRFKTFPAVANKRRTGRSRKRKKSKGGRLLPPLLKTLRFLIADEAKIPTKSVLKIKRPLKRKQIA